MEKLWQRTRMFGGRAAWVLALGAAVLAATAAGALACGIPGPGPGHSPGPTLTVWTAGVDDWFVATNWDSGVPTSTITARIDNWGEADIAAPGAVAKVLQLGYAADGGGTVGLSGTGSLAVAGDEYLGVEGAGTFLQYGGSNRLQRGQLILGQQVTGVGTYCLGSGQLYVGNGEVVGDSGIGSFLQAAGTNTMCRGLVIGGDSGSIGAYELDDGSLAVSGSETVGQAGQGAFSQFGGTHTINCGGLIVAAATDSWGAYSLYGGALAVHGAETVGSRGVGAFSQFDGTHSISCSLTLGDAAGGDGTFALLGGDLSVDQCEYVGDGGIGLFAQVGGTHTVDQTLYVGGGCNVSGLLAIGGGSLVAGSLQIGVRGGAGELSISEPSANVEVRSNVTFGQQATLTAVSGAALHIDRGDFCNRSNNPAALAGLGNLTVIFERSSWCGNMMDVAGTDLGAVAAGFDNNFALDGLVVGNSGPARVNLTSAFNNWGWGWGWNCHSRGALYVHNLTVTAGSTLNLNGVKLYYDGTLDNQGTITGGTAVVIP